MDYANIKIIFIFAAKVRNPNDPGLSSRLSFGTRWGIRPRGSRGTRRRGGGSCWPGAASYSSTRCRCVFIRNIVISVLLRPTKWFLLQNGHIYEDKYSLGRQVVKKVLYNVPREFQSVGLYCSCCAAQVNKGNFQKTFYKTFFTTWRLRL